MFFRLRNDEGCFSVENTVKINSNISSLNTQRTLDKTDKNTATTMQHLSSGRQINSAKDDAAGMAIALQFAAQIVGSQQATRNTNDGISMLQTAEGGLEQATDDLQRMRELAVQSANVTNSPNDRQALQAEYSQLQSGVSQNIENTDFNGVKVLSDSQSLEFQTGPNADPATNRTVVSINNILADSDMKVAVQTSDISSQGLSSSAISQIDAALDKVTAERSRIGASLNKMESTVNNLGSSIESQSAARSRIEDADYAKETSNLARDLILKEASIAVLGHSKVNSNLVLGLLNK